MLCVAVLTRHGVAIWQDVQFVAGQLRVQMPLFLGQLHSDPVADVWKKRPNVFPSILRQVDPTQSTFKQVHGYMQCVPLLGKHDQIDPMPSALRQVDTTPQHLA